MNDPLTAAPFNLWICFIRNRVTIGVNASWLIVRVTEYAPILDRPESIPGCCQRLGKSSEAAYPLTICASIS